MTYSLSWSAALIGLLIAMNSAAAAPTACPGADPKALAWLDKMSRSAHEVSYSGVVTFQRGDDMQVMQINHSVANGAASESLTRLTGQGVQVLRVDHPLECVHPGHRLLRLGSELSQGDCGIARQYRFSVGEGERVAGREAVRVRVEPRDMYRYGYVMELDQETGLLLKTRTVGADGRVLESFQFANVSYADDESPLTDVEVVHEAAHPPPATGELPTLPTGKWVVRWLPVGFTATDLPAGATPRRTYTDGLAVFSVFLERLNREITPGEGMTSEGSTTSYTRGMAVGGRPVLVTVIGEIPLNTARVVADSVRWTK